MKLWWTFSATCYHRTLFSLLKSAKLGIDLPMISMLILWLITSLYDMCISGRHRQVHYVCKYLVNLKFLILKHLKSVQYLIGHFSNPLILYYMYYILTNIWCVSVPFIWNTQFEISSPYFKIDDQFFQYSVETNIQEVLWYQNRWKWERGQT